MSEILLCTILPLLGVVVGWFANHWLSSARDRRARMHALEDAREDRKRDFIGFMGGFRSEAERSYPTEFCKVFPSKVHQFRVESAKVGPDLSGERRARLDQAVTVLCQLTDSQVSEVGSNENYFGRTRVTEAIDAVIRLLD